MRGMDAKQTKPLTASADLRRSQVKAAAANSGNTMSQKALHYIQKLKAPKP